ncbi:hypothetical protein QQ045_018651 [Rhodiola kirilowii]
MDLSEGFAGGGTNTGTTLNGLVGHELPTKAIFVTKTEVKITESFSQTSRGPECSRKCKSRSMISDLASSRGLPTVTLLGSEIDWCFHRNSVDIYSSVSVDVESTRAVGLWRVWIARWRSAMKAPNVRGVAGIRRVKLRHGPGAALAVLSVVPFVLMVWTTFLPAVICVVPCLPINLVTV